MNELKPNEYFKITERYMNENDEERVNHLRGRMIDDGMQIYINSGKNKEGKRVSAKIRLSQASMLRLMKFLQCNIK